MYSEWPIYFNILYICIYSISNKNYYYPLSLVRPGVNDITRANKIRSLRLKSNTVDHKNLFLHFLVYINPIPGRLFFPKIGEGGGIRPRTISFIGQKV